MKRAAANDTITDPSAAITEFDSDDDTSNDATSSVFTDKTGKPQGKHKKKVCILVLSLNRKMQEA